MPCAKHTGHGAQATGVKGREFQTEALPPVPRVDAGADRCGAGRGAKTRSAAILEV